MTSSEHQSIHDSVREYWDADAATYDLAPSHVAQNAAEQAAWRAVLTRHLPPAPARILDLGAGTGFLSLPLARLGYQVTAVDLSRGMLECLRSESERRGLEITIVEGPAEDPPAGPFDAVVERLLLWTLPDAHQALVAWRRVAASGRLLCFEGSWGRADRMEAARSRLRDVVRRLRRLPPEHHDRYPEQVSTQLPFSSGMALATVAEAIERAGWGNARLERLRDVEWTKVMSQPLVDRLLGVTPEFVLVADDAPRPAATLVRTPGARAGAGG